MHDIFLQDGDGDGIGDTTKHLERLSGLLYGEHFSYSSIVLFPLNQGQDFGLPGC